MKFYVIWRSSLRAILKNRRRSFLTMIGIIIGIASVITIMSLGRGFQKETIKNISNSEEEELTVEVYFMPEDQNLANSNVKFFQDTDLQKIKEIDGVKKVEMPHEEVEQLYYEMMVKGKKTSKQIDLITQSSIPVTHGRDVKLVDEKLHNKVATIDSTTAKDLYGSVKKAIGHGIEIKGQLFQIVGVYPANELLTIFSMPESNIQIPKTTYYDYFDKEENTSLVNVTLSADATPNEVTDKVVNLLKNEGTMKDAGEYQVLDMSILSDGIGQILSGLTLFISAIAGISLFIAGVGVMNMMYISVSERTKEIGIRRAMGATENSIKMQFLLEGITITMIGGIIGYILGILLAYAISAFLPFSVSIDAFTILLAVGIATIVGLIFSVMPASAAAKKDLIDILR